MSDRVRKNLWTAYRNYRQPLRVQGLLAEDQVNGKLNPQFYNHKEMNSTNLSDTTLMSEGEELKEPLDESERRE